MKKIDLSYNKIKGGNFTSFENLPYLEFLDLSETNINRTDLQTLHGLSQLKELRVEELSNPTIRDQDLVELQNALPNCKVVWWGMDEDWQI